MDQGKKETVEVAEPEPEETEADKRAKCCQQCAEGVQADQSGDPPGALACKSLTDKVQAACVLWFDANPMNGKEAQTCVDETATESESEGETEAAPAG